MATQLEILQARRLALVRDLTSASESLSHGDRSRKVRSVAEMERQLAILDQQLASLDSGTRVRTVRLLTKDNW